MNGNFVWYDYMAKDIDKAIAFYGETVGWKAQKWGDQGYRMLMVGTTAVGGITDLSPEARSKGTPPHWLSYIETDNVDDIVKRCTKLKGTVVSQPRDIPTVGRVAILRDPQGATFGVVRSESGQHMSTLDPSKVGAFSWSELLSSDWKAGFKFYSELFGWKKTEAMQMGEMGTYQMFAANKKDIGGMMNRPKEMKETAWLYYVTTEDIDAAVTRVKTHGGKLVNGPMQIPGGGRVAQFLDNQGGSFALHQGA